jgi:hypothetical protein
MAAQWTDAMVRRLSTSRLLARTFAPMAPAALLETA